MIYEQSLKSTSYSTEIIFLSLQSDSDVAENPYNGFNVILDLLASQFVHAGIQNLLH